MALGQLDLAIELLARDDAAIAGANALLEGRGDAARERAVHETRKALKRLRALVRLLREELGEQRFEREHAILRDAARRLAGARDAEVMVDTLDALLERHPRKLGRRRPLIELRKRLVAERAAAAQRTLGDEPTRAEVLRELSGLRERARAVEPARTARHRARRARPAAALPAGAPPQAACWRAGKGGSAARMHEWRKRVKDLRYAAEILGLRPLARRADALGELLGEEHDLVAARRACFRRPGERRSRASAASGRARRCSSRSRAAAGGCASGRCARESACTGASPKQFRDARACARARARLQPSARSRAVKRAPRQAQPALQTPAAEPPWTHVAADSRIWRNRPM